MDRLHVALRRVVCVGARLTTTDLFPSGTGNKYSTALMCITPNYAKKAGQEINGVRWLSVAALEPNWSLPHPVLSRG